jgi:hypothetical protein
MQAYDGLGPEVINSRLAMLGFAVAAFWELTQGIDIFQQVDKYPLITIATFVTFTVASWIPFMQGQSYNVKSGPFTPAVSFGLGKGGVTAEGVPGGCVGGKGQVVERRALWPHWHLLRIRKCG